MPAAALDIFDAHISEGAVLGAFYSDKGGKPDALGLLHLVRAPQETAAFLQKAGDALKLGDANGPARPSNMRSRHGAQLNR